MLNTRESWLSEMDGILSKSILMDMLAQEPSVTLTVRIGGREILQGKEKKERKRKNVGERVRQTLLYIKKTRINSQIVFFI